MSATRSASSPVARKVGRARWARSVNSATASSSTESEGTRQVTSPEPRSVSRLVVRIVNRGQPLSSVVIDVAADVQ